MIEAMRWLLAIVLAACGSKSSDSPGSGEAPAAPKLTNQLIEAVLAAELDANDNPFDSVCADEGGWTARYNKDPRGRSWADAWIKQKGFDSLAQYDEVRMHVERAATLVMMRRSDPSFAPKRAIPAEDIALVGNYADRFAAAATARAPRLMPDCKKK